MANRRICCFFCPILLLSFLAACSPPPLEFNLPESGVEKYQISLDNIAQYRLPGQSNYQLAYEGHNVFNVEQEVMPPKNENEFRLRVVYRRIRMTSEVSLGSQEASHRIDTHSPETSSDPTGQRAMNAILDRPMILVFAPNGQIKQVEGLDAMIAAFRQQIPRGQDHNEMADSLTFAFGEGHLKNIYESYSMIFPRSQEEPRQQWKRKRTIYSMLLGGLNFTQQCALTNPDGDPAIIQYNGIIHPTDQANNGRYMVPGSGMNMELIQGRIKGTVIYDRAKARLIRIDQQKTILIGYGGEEHSRPAQKIINKLFVERK